MVISPLHTVDQSLVHSDYMITSPLPIDQQIFYNIGNFNAEDVQDELVGTNGGGQDSQDNLPLTVVIPARDDIIPRLQDNCVQCTLEGPIRTQPTEDDAYSGFLDWRYMSRERFQLFIELGIWDRLIETLKRYYD